MLGGFAYARPTRAAVGRAVNFIGIPPVDGRANRIIRIGCRHAYSADAAAMAGGIDIGPGVGRGIQFPNRTGGGIARARAIGIRNPHGPSDAITP